MEQQQVDGYRRMLYRIVEKSMSPRRRAFEQISGVWYAELEQARARAAGIAQTTLAHRLFIVQNNPGALPTVVEEIELAPLRDRMAAAHCSVLAARDPARLARELALDESRPQDFRRLALAG